MLKRLPTTICTDFEVLEAVEAAAKKSGVSRSDLVNSILSETLAKTGGGSAKDTELERHVQGLRLLKL